MKVVDGTAAEAAAWRLAETRPKKEHGQLCPVWTQRLRKVRHAAHITDCDCWILRDARQDAAIVIEAYEWARDPASLNEDTPESEARWRAYAADRE